MTQTVVKPLEWKAVRPKVHEAESIIGKYSAFEVQEGYVYLSCHYGAEKIDLGAMWSNDSLAAAKAAAQADFDTRIQSAICAPPSFQDRVANAHVALFADGPTDVPERCARFFEESNETCQALGMTREEAHALVDYVYDRPVGEPAKEIGAASLTLTSLCVVAGYERSECEEADLAKLVQPETIARIRAKRSTRHGRGPLPGFDPAPVAAGPVEIPGKLEIYEGKLTKVVDTRRTGWWRFHEGYDRNGYCDNPGRGY